VTEKRLFCNDQGQWVFCDASGQQHTGVSVVRAYPVTAPHAGWSILTEGGHECHWVASVEDETETFAQALREALAEREFLPRITALHGVSSFSVPSTWDVETDRGRAQLVLKAEEDIRRLNTSALLLVDAAGVQYLIRDLAQMDKATRKLLDRFL
jgi:Domain of unknown function (DUF1854)